MTIEFNKETNTYKVSDRREGFYRQCTIIYLDSYTPEELDYAKNKVTTSLDKDIKNGKIMN